MLIFCKEHHVNVIYGGHYATETFGVIALAEYVQKKFNLPFEFIDVPSGYRSKWVGESLYGVPGVWGNGVWE